MTIRINGQEVLPRDVYDRVMEKRRTEKRAWLENYARAHNRRGKPMDDPAMTAEMAERLRGPRSVPPLEGPVLASELAVDDVFGVLARRAAGKMQDEEEVDNLIAFDPTTILTLAKILYAAFKLYRACAKAPAAVAEDCRRPPWVQRVKLRLLIRHHLADEGLERHVGRHMFESLLSAGRQMDEQTAKAAMDRAWILSSAGMTV